MPPNGFIFVEKRIFFHMPIESKVEECDRMGTFKYNRIVIIPQRCISSWENESSVFSIEDSLIPNSPPCYRSPLFSPSFFPLSFLVVFKIRSRERNRTSGWNVSRLIARLPIANAARLTRRSHVAWRGPASRGPARRDIHVARN